MPSSNESGTPSSCMSGLFGSHNTPPDIAVEPPRSGSFSTTSVARPFAAAVTAPQSPPPDPTTTTSVACSAPAIRRRQSAGEVLVELAVHVGDDRLPLRREPVLLVAQGVHALLLALHVADVLPRDDPPILGVVTRV